MPLVSSVGRFLNAANNKADQLTAGAKALLCLPSIVGGLPDLGKGIIGGVVANIGTALEGIGDSISGIVNNAINGVVSQITGAINGFIGELAQAFVSVYDIALASHDFADGIVDRVKDVGNFISDKENCDFAAATMLNCITAQAVGAVTNKGAVEIAKGLKPVTDFASDVSNSIAAPGGAINRVVDKTAGQIDRATRMIDKSNIF